jgi:hypothetical protein
MALVLAGSTSAALVAALASTAPAQAAAYEWDTATAGSPPGGMTCVSMTGAEACFQKHDDRWWVRDTASDGHSATASWENDVFDGIQWRMYRQGSCVNKLGYGQWGVCNKDYYESGSTNDLGGKGSQLTWQACVYDSAGGTWHGCSTDIAWVNNDG